MVWAVPVILFAFASHGAQAASPPTNTWEALKSCADELGIYSFKTPTSIQWIDFSPDRSVVFPDGSGFPIEVEDVIKHGRVGSDPYQRILTIGTKPIEIVEKVEASKNGIPQQGSGKWTQSCVTVEVSLHKDQTVPLGVDIRTFKVVSGGQNLPREKCGNAVDLVRPLRGSIAVRYMIGNIRLHVDLTKYKHNPDVLILGGVCDDGSGMSEEPVYPWYRNFDTKEELVARVFKSWGGYPYESCAANEQASTKSKPQVIICDEKNFNLIETRLDNLIRIRKSLIGPACSSPHLPTDLRERIDKTEQDLFSNQKTAQRNRDWFRDYCKNPYPLPTPTQTPQIPAKAIKGTKSKTVPVSPPALPPSQKKSGPVGPALE